MVPFCSVEDYQVRYGAVDDTTALQACLEDATDVICAELESSDIDYTDPSESFTARLRRVCRSVARRAFGADAGGCDVPFGATQMSETNDFATASYQLANPYGDLFLTQAEKDSLGIGAMRAAVISPYA